LARKAKQPLTTGARDYYVKLDPIEPVSNGAEA
jgi:hypothetical protein